MAFLFQSSKRNTVPAITGLQVQTAVNVMPIPIVYGCPRIPMNIIYANGFTAVPQKSGGKGKALFGSGKGQTAGYKYYITFLGALCEGQVGSVLVIYDNAATYTPGSIPRGSGKDYTEFNGGTDNVAPWGVITTMWPDDAFYYPNTAYSASSFYPLDQSATIPQLNFVLYGKKAGTAPLFLYTAPDGEEYLLDADPAEVIDDFLTHELYGVGFPSAYIDSSTLFTSSNGYDPYIGDAALSTYAQAIGLAWSLCLNNSEPASSILDRWTKNLAVAPVWTGYILKFIPYWDSFNATNPGFDNRLGGQLKYYKPNIPSLFDLSDDDFIQSPQADDPVTVNRMDIADVKNIVRGNFRDRNNAFNDNYQETQDESLVELYGPRPDRMGTMDEYSLPEYAFASVRMQLQRYGSIRRTYSFQLGWQWAILDPMDIVTITDETLRLNKFPVRITQIEEDDKGVLTISAEEFPLGAATASLYPTQANTPPITINPAVDAPAVNIPFIYEPPADQLTAQGRPVSPTVVIGGSAGPSGVYNSNWGGAFVWVSNDNITYVQLPGLIDQPSRQGVTTSDLPTFVGSNPDTLNTLSVNLSESAGTLESVTADQAAGGFSVCAIRGADGCLELLGYTTATLTSANNYDLTGLYRGLYGTVAAEHLSGSEFLRVDANVYEDNLPPQFVGQTVYVKLQSYNIYGLVPQDLSDCIAYTYQPVGAAISPVGNPLYDALVSGVGADLNLLDGPSLDLNLGGASECGIVVGSVDLNA